MSLPLVTWHPLCCSTAPWHHPAPLSPPPLSFSPLCVEQDHIPVPYQPDSSSNPSSTTSSTPSSPAPPLPPSATPPSPLHPSPQCPRQQKQFNLPGTCRAPHLHVRPPGTCWGGGSAEGVLGVRGLLQAGKGGKGSRNEFWIIQEGPRESLAQAAAQSRGRAQGFIQL